MSPRREAIKVLIADDHPVVRQGLRTFLGIQDDIEVVGEAEDGTSAVTLAESLEPDIVLMDLKMPGADGLTALTELRARGVQARVLVLTSVTERGHVLPAVQAGAAGYLYKDVDPQALVQAIRAVHDGHVLFAPDAAEAMLRDGTADGGGGDDRGLAALTEREREVLVHIARGRSNREIARALVVSEKTVKTHVSNLLMKLGVQDRTQAALYAVRHGVGTSGAAGETGETTARG
ncbi:MULTISPECIES: response regulator [Actinomadura]|uniref:DNA-binding response regulator, NarL/FixJ family, contains REC and HTH domains n=1 Tax=Actinomadura madurae TaxID=1993 RepID=A0A1I5V5V8_9ACTN|nr:response regulator transcription factor [Actinomadura madurae]MCP9952386.1 response regulator transcription factor [Actinomadura madurae]MCP9969151.1 response regulator transcription factor [Actinomadura madurae]MCP9981627.1 response regulator transcription factor [Actinomadura madurae]MCQ0006865.1 response regulator transcription factor [Actinomadura madurae]MCQ0017826.1 response regulator transcription factor [Actinomadura madurae]